MNIPNKFGELSDKYDTSRRGYPDELFEYLRTVVGKENPKTLDIGCGTGISTRQLKEYGFDVTGADKDVLMIEKARKHDAEITYTTASADILPFPTEHFDVVTAFTSLHWFSDDKSMSEIKRVLKKSGILFSALKRTRKDGGNENYYKEYDRILSKYAGKEFNSSKDYFPVELFATSGFEDIKEKVFYTDEKYTVDQAITLIQSLSLWHLVPESGRSDMLRELKAFYEKHLVDGFSIKSREILTTLGHRKKS